VENLFDDQDDHRKGRGDKDFDPWFSHEPQALQRKLDHLATVLAPLNAGKGPDILCLAEVESLRAADLLREALERKLGDPRLAYKNVLYESPGGGRHTATAILTRLSVEKDRTRLLGRRQRILEGRIKVAGRPLVVIASHWSSRISDKTGAARARY